MPTESLTTKVRIIDTFFPIAKGGTYCIPGPFGAGKTVLQQITSRYADVDIVVIAACGERAGEIVETMREFPELVDPRTGRSLMERTIIIANTSAMPVAARSMKLTIITPCSDRWNFVNRRYCIGGSAPASVTAGACFQSSGERHRRHSQATV